MSRTSSQQARGPASGAARPRTGQRQEPLGCGGLNVFLMSPPERPVSGPETAVTPDPAGRLPFSGNSPLPLQ